jgi:multicomponent Na+:H+ antiporter subunit G
MFVLDLFAWISLIIGAIFSIIGGIGIVRLPEFFSRMHAGGISDTMGAGLILFGLILHDGVLTLASAKLLMIGFFFIVTSPTACHALAKSALAQGLKPELEINTLESTDP